MPLPAAAGVFKPPPGCTLEVTVQNRSCTVNQHYRCTADPEGFQRLSVFDEDGLSHESVIDAETRWIESRDPETGLEDRLEEDAPDHASLATLLADGVDDFDFWTRSNSGERLRHVGADSLTGETVVIDGETLDVTAFDLTTFSEGGEVLIERTGQQFVSRRFGRFYGGAERSTDWTGTAEDSNDSPVTFAFPGETGFGSTTPQFDCDMMMTGAPPAGGRA